jgi:hypothetical protein
VGCSCGVDFVTAHDVQMDEMWVAAVGLVGTAHNSVASLDSSAVTVCAVIGCHPEAVFVNDRATERATIGCHLSEQCWWSQSITAVVMFAVGIASFSATHCNTACSPTVSWGDS